MLFFPAVHVRKTPFLHVALRKLFCQEIPINLKDKYNTKQYI